MSLANLRIQTKLLLGFGLVLVLLLAVSAFGIIQVHRVTGQTAEINERWMPSVSSIEEMRLAIADYRRQQYAHLVSTEAAGMDKYEGQMAKAIADLEAGRKIYDPLPQTEEESKIYTQFEGDWKAYLETSVQWTALSRSGKKDEAKTALTGNAMRDAFYKVSGELERIIEINNDGAKQAGITSSAIAGKALWMISLAAAVATVVGLLVAWLIARGIARPVQGMAAVMQQVADGDLTVRVPVVGTDEVGQMGSALNATVESLHQVMTEIRSAADQTAASGEELSASAQNISSGAQTQASTVEEISASVQELTRSIERVASEASEANRVAQTTSATAEDGNKTVGRSIEGMKAINDSSAHIAKIIGVINQIANQTNLLALNAAIEAASAGEHGLGFAVVADEVRKLAERSSQAAQEIAQLIEESGKRVEEGANLSKAVGTSLQAIVAGISQTSQGMAGISSGAGQQALAAKEVSKNVEGISAVTEENSASAEEMAASAEELSAQAQRLQELVARFRLGEEGAPVRRTANHQTATAGSPMRKTAGHGMGNGSPAAKRKTASIQVERQAQDGEVAVGKALYHE